MTDHGQKTAPLSAQSSARFEEAINNLSLGIVVFDEKREVVFCNERYREMYGLSPEQVKPGTPTRELIRHRLNLGLKVQIAPDDYTGAHVGCQRERKMGTRAVEMGRHCDRHRSARRRGRAYSSHDRTIEGMSSVTA